MKYKSTVLFHKDWKILIKSLPEDKQLIFWDLFMSYDCGIETICDDVTVFAIWKFISSQLDNMSEKYTENIVNRNIENGKKGGRPSKNKQLENNPKNPMGYLETQKTLNNNINENININNNVNKNNNKHLFIKPSIEEIKVYVKENTLLVDGEYFFNYYEANGWKVGKNQMKDWKATVNMWNARNKKELPSQPIQDESKPFDYRAQVSKYDGKTKYQPINRYENNAGEKSHYIQHCKIHGFKMEEFWHDGTKLEQTW